MFVGWSKTIRDFVDDYKNNSHEVFFDKPHFCGPCIYLMFTKSRVNYEYD